ncbi:hypothetical protein ACHWQZ_G003749 [Mnemiopsis leidyi]
MVRFLTPSTTPTFPCKMKLEVPKEDPQFTLFSPENTLPTEERTQFRNRANDVFGSLSRDTVVPSEITPAMAPPLPPQPRPHSRFLGGSFKIDHVTRVEDKVNITPSTQLYNSIVSDKVEKSRLTSRPSKPFARANKRFFRAQHEISPHKFTKYSLEDTNIADDSENKTIALNFLNDLRKNKEGQLEESASSTKEEKIVFRKRERLTKNEGDDTIKKAPSKHKSVVVQEEYVIGQTKSMSKRHARAAGSSSALRQHARAASKSSSKGKERSRVTACYLDDEENEEDELD